jgi:hypothetical protein
MKSFIIKSTMIGTLAVSLVACNSGSGDQNNTPDSNLPRGNCQLESSASIFTPSLLPEITTNFIQYSYDLSYPSIFYRENFSSDDSPDFIMSIGTGTTKPLGGACAQSLISHPESTYNDDNLYYTNCKAEVKGNQMTFTSNYSIYIPSQYPGNGTPLKTGTVNFICTLI